MTVDELIKELNAIWGDGLGDSVVYAYEGEKTGIVVTKDGAEIAFFPTTPG